MPRKSPEPLGRAPLAYENPAFLNSPDGRISRILSEYSEPLSRFRRERIQDTVVFFGSARFRGLDEASRELELLENTGSQQPAPDEEQPARQPISNREKPATSAFVAPKPRSRWRATTKTPAGSPACLPSGPKTLRARRHRFVVTSGGGPGIMEAANRGAYEAGGKIHRPQHPPALRADAQPATSRPALNFEFHYFFMRKYWFAYLAKALVVFPGGFGTLDEMFEILTLAQTQKLAKKITVVIYGSSYWKEVLNLDVLVEKGAISPARPSTSSSSPTLPSRPSSCSATASFATTSSPKQPAPTANPISPT